MSDDLPPAASGNPYRAERDRKGLVYRSVLRPPKDGRVWRYGDSVTTVKTEDQHRKTLDAWAGDEDLARECVELWQARRETPSAQATKTFRGYPSSPAGFYHEEARRLGLGRPRVVWSAQAFLAKYFHGGWAQALALGHVAEPVTYYDIRRAYQWAGSLPLPVRYDPHRPDDENFLVILRVSDRRDFVPPAFEYPVVLATREDIDVYGLRGEVLAGVSWAEEDTRGADVWGHLEDLPPKALKLASRSYWGQWAQSEGVTSEIWKNGKCSKRWTLPPARRDIPAATIIVHRVIRRLYCEAVAGAQLVATDAVLTDRELPVGPAFGDWSVKMECPGGVFILGANRWTEVPVAANLRDWLKVSGVVRNSDAFLDVSALNQLRERQLLEESELQRALHEHRSARLAESDRVREILGPSWQCKPYRI